MMKRIIPFMLVFFLLLCGCAHTERAVQPDDPDGGLYEKIDELESNVSGGVIPIHTPDHDDPSKPDEGAPSKEDSTSSEDEAGPELGESPKDPDQAEQVPIYPVDGDENFSSDMTQEPGATPDGTTGEGDETDASQGGEDAGKKDEPDPSNRAASVTITPYAMNTVYENDDGESILELRIGTPVIETKASEAELLFNRYYSTKALEYTLYVNETLFPEIKTSQTADTEPQISSAEMAYSVLYNDDGYLCVLTSYTEVLADRFEKRAEAALFDMSTAVLLDEWEVLEASDASLETILEKTAAVPVEPEENAAAE